MRASEDAAAIKAVRRAKRLADRKLVVERLAAGKTVAHVAAELDVSRVYIRNLAREAQADILERSRQSAEVYAAWLTDKALRRMHRSEMSEKRAGTIEATFHESASSGNPDAAEIAIRAADCAARARAEQRSDAAEVAKIQGANAQPFDSDLTGPVALRVVVETSTEAASSTTAVVPITQDAPDPT